MDEEEDEDEEEVVTVRRLPDLISSNFSRKSSLCSGAGVAHI
jgi:hypothetical protein